MKDIQLNYEVLSNNEIDASGEVVVIDLFGRIIKSVKWNGNLKGSMELSPLSEGMYTLVLKTSAWKISKRFVKL